MRAWLVAADQVSSGLVFECVGAGDTCWAVTPSGDSNRDCGCSSGGWAGDGIYMGGYKNSSTCGSEGGGFAGPKTDGIAKGNLDSIGFVMRIRGRASGQSQSRGVMTVCVDRVHFHIRDLQRQCTASRDVSTPNVSTVC